MTLALCAVSIPAYAQASHPRADSAAQARAAYRRAVTASRAQDLPTARAEMRKAAEWWPAQQAYLESAASLAAVARDTADAIHWIDALAALGVGSSLDSDTSYAAFAGNATFAAAAARLASATSDVARGRVRLTVPDTMLHPEGVAFDARTQRWFIGSVRQRKVVAIAKDGTQADFVKPAADGIGGVFGMVVDAPRRTLWIATTSLPRMEGFTATDSGRVGIFGYDIDTGTLRHKAWAMRDSSTAHTFGDVTVASNGDIYASDSQSPWIYRLAAGSDTLVRFATHPLFRSLQGMAMAPDGRTMFVADYSHGLVRLDLTTHDVTRDVTILRTPPHVTTLGVDGLYWHRGSLIAVQNGVTPMRVVRFCLSTDGRSVRAVEVLDRNPALADEPTLGTIVDDSLFYVATSQWEKFDADGRRVPNAKLRPATVLGVGLDSGRACPTP